MAEDDEGGEPLHEDDPARAFDDWLIACVVVVVDGDEVFEQCPMAVVAVRVGEAGRAG